MKIPFSFSFSLALTLATMPMVNGAALVGTIYEGFDYTGGAPIGGSAGGTGWGSTPTTWTQSASGGTNTNSNVLVSTSGLSYPGLASTGNAYDTTNTTPMYRQLGQSVDTGTMWFSVLLQETSAAETNRSLLFSLYGNVGSSSNRELISVGQSFSSTATIPNTGGNIGLLVYDGTNMVLATQPATPTALTVGTTHFLVGKVEFGINETGVDRISLYVNPTMGTEPTTAYATADFEIGAINNLRPFAGGASGGQGQSRGLMDEIRLGSSYADVSPVPEPTAVTLFGLASFGLLARRRRG